MSDLMHVPTMSELVALGLATVSPGTQGLRYTPTAEGQRMIYDAQRHNAAVGRLEDERRIEETARQRYIWEMINGPRRGMRDEHDDWRRAERTDWKAETA